MSSHIIVSRHEAGVAFLLEECPEFADAPVLASATPDDVRGQIVGGNLPLHLACLAREVVAIEFGGPPPRGTEYGLPEMRAAGARVARYTVQSGGASALESTLDQGGFPAHATELARAVAVEARRLAERAAARGE